MDEQSRLDYLSLSLNCIPAHSTPWRIDLVRNWGRSTIVDTAKGEVTNFQTRSEPYGDSTSAMIWTFRLESFDSEGNRLPPVAVEMRGLTAEGFINDGDKVEVSGLWREGVLVAESAQNMTTRSTVKLKGPPKWVGYFFIVVFTGVSLGFIAIMIGAIASLITHWR